MTKFLEYIFEIIGWIRIASSPTLIGIIAGISIYYLYPGITGLLFSILIGVSGVTLGIIWATKVFKSKKGTFWFLSRTMSTPETEEREEEN